MTNRHVEAAIGLSVTVLGIAMLQRCAVRDARTLGLAASAVPLLITVAGLLVTSGKFSQIGGRR